MKDHKPQINFIGMGDQKSATTWIYTCLSEHPEICTSSTKETRFFDDDYLYEKGLEKYQDFFSDCSSGKIVGEYSPSYIHDEKAMKRIKKHFSDVKLLICFRDPVEKLHSSYRYNRVSGTGNMLQYQSFDEAVRSQDSMIDRVHHGRNLERLYQYFDADQVFVGFYQDVVDKPKQFIQNIYWFLGADDSFVPESLKTKHNVTGEKEFKSTKVAYFISKISGKIKSYNSIQKTLTKIGARKLYRYINKINKEKTERGKEGDSDKQEVSESAKNFIRETLDDDIDKLEQLTGKDLSEWKL